MGIKYCEALKLNYAPRIELREIYGLLVYLMLIKQAVRQKCSQILQESIELHFNKAVSHHICNCTKKDAITGVLQCIYLF